MTSAATHFNLALMASLKEAQNSLEALNARGAENIAHVEKDMRARVAALGVSAEKAKAGLKVAEAEVLKWVDDSAATVTAWKSKFDAQQLAHRAERTELYAEAASQVAIAALAAAEKAALDAKLARADAHAAKASKVAA